MRKYVRDKRHCVAVRHAEQSHLPFFDKLRCFDPFFRRDVLRSAHFVIRTKLARPPFFVYWIVPGQAFAVNKVDKTMKLSL